MFKIDRSRLKLLLTQESERAEFGGERGGGREEEVDTFLLPNTSFPGGQKTGSRVICFHYHNTSLLAHDSVVYAGRNIHAGCF